MIMRERMKRNAGMAAVAAGEGGRIEREIEAINDLKR